MQMTGTVCILSLALLVPVAAVAADNDNDTALELVVVTAERRSESVQDIGVAVTAVSGAEIQSLRIQQPLGLSTISPSLSTMNSTDRQHAAVSHPRHRTR